MMRVLLLPLFFLAACAFAQTAPLNDTGQTQCFDAGALDECTSANTGDGDQVSHPRQDGRFGRDAQAGAGALAKTGSGEAGFDFTKIANDGSELADSAVLGSSATDWACTRDNVTGLIWEVKLDDISQLRHREHLYTWYDGTDGNVGTNTCNSTLAQCNIESYKLAVKDVGLCGKTDWRVPTRRELLSIVHHGKSNLAIDTTFFPNTLLAYWSSDLDAVSGEFTGAWDVAFTDGGDTFAQVNASKYVRLVSGTVPPEPNPRFVDNLDGTVTDPATGLMWDRCVWGQTGTDCFGGSAADLTWQQALRAAVTANAGAGHRGYNDWRLPNRTELESLVDITKATPPRINTTAFPNTLSDFFWSSTVYTPSNEFAPNPDGAWVVSFGDGGSSAPFQTDVNRVRLVRSGQSFDALAPAALGIISQPSSAAQSGVEFPQQPVVEVRDANGDAVLAAGTGITAAIASGGGTLTGTTTVATDADGRATFTDLAIAGSVGDRTLSFSAGSLTPATSGTIFLLTEPDAPTAVMATAGSAQATVTWTAPTNTGGSAITGYTVTSSPGSQTCSTAGTTSCAVIGLTNGTAYTFTVIATNAQGSSLPSIASAAATPGSVPDAPTAVVATAGSAQATVSWTAPTNTGGSAITGYIVIGDSGGSCSVAGDVTECTIIGLTNETEYTFKVIAINAQGNSLFSAPSNPVVPSELLFRDRFEGD